MAEECLECKGTGVCTQCGGSGNVEAASLLGDAGSGPSGEVVKCPACGGTGKCKQCDGEGCRE